MAIIAGVAAGVGAAASVASTALKASQGGPSMEQSRMYAPRTLRERLLYQEVRNLGQLETDIMTNALGQYSNLSPHLYAAALGMVPEYEDQTEDAAAARENLTQLQAQRDQLKNALIERAGMSKGQRRQARREGKAAGTWVNKKSMQRQLRMMDRQLNEARNRARELEAMPRRITGFKEATPDQIPADSPLSSLNPRNQISSLTNQALINALRGDEPIDQTMVREWNEREDRLRERLRRNLGPDYAVSTPGQRALADLDRDRTEAFQQYNQQAVRDYSSLSIANAQMREAQLAGILERGTYLPSKAMALAGQLQVPISAQMALLQYRQEGRKMSDPYAVAPKPDPTAELLGRGGAGLMSAGPALGGMAGKLFGGAQTPVGEDMPGFISDQNQFGETTELITPTGRIIR